MKTCTKCKVDKEESNFYKWKGNKIGLYPSCKDCVSDYMKDYHSKNKDKFSEKNKTYRRQHKAKIDRYAKTWRELNDTYCREYQKEYYQKNKERKLDKVSQYAKTDKGRAVRRNTKYKRKLKLIETDITSEWLVNLYRETEFCCLCLSRLSNNGMDLKGKQLDHIMPLNVDGGHKKNNVRVICRECNQSRVRDGSDIKQQSAENII